MVEEDVGRDEGAGVDKGVAGDAVLILQLDERVEGRTRGLAPHARPEVLALEMKSQGKREHLGDTLYGKPNVGVAHATGPAVEGLEADARLVGVHASQSGDVVGLLTEAGIRLNVAPDSFEDMLVVHGISM